MTVMIMGSFYLSAMFGAEFSTFLINPSDNLPDIIVTNGQQIEKFYAKEKILGVPDMLQTMSLATLALYLIALILIDIRPKFPVKVESTETEESQVAMMTKEKQLKSPLIPFEEKVAERNHQQFNTLFTI